MPADLIGPGGRLFADPTPGPDEVKFRQDNTSSAYYNSPYFLAHKNQVQPIPRRRNDQPLDLANFLPAEIMSAIKSAGKISFHAVGDTGAAKVNRSQTAATAIGHETAVADAMVADVQSVDGPAFFFHLGDVIYNFGEAQYYYDQFNEPFRGYDRPIFAIPGNHDGMVFGHRAPRRFPPRCIPDQFLRLPTPGPRRMPRIDAQRPTSPASISADAPFVTILGLYSNGSTAGRADLSQGGLFSAGRRPAGFSAELSLNLNRPHRQQARVIRGASSAASADARHGGSLESPRTSMLAARPPASSDALRATPISTSATRVMPDGKEIPMWWRPADGRHHPQGAAAAADHDRRHTLRSP